MSQQYDLIIERAGERARTIPLPTEGTATLGRHAEATIVLADTQASRRHAELTCREGRVWLRDLGSANGTFSGGQRLAAPVELCPGDAITIGDTTLRLALAVPDATVSPSPPRSAPCSGRRRRWRSPRARWKRRPAPPPPRPGSARC